MVVLMEITLTTLEEARWRTGLSRAALFELNEVVAEPLSDAEAPQISVVANIVL
jgi:hypothetical protein